MTRTIRLTAWVAILALAAFQAYAQRFSIGPDGMSYLDLSDAVVNGRWSMLVNLYWSPLYPLLVGVGRVIAGAGPRWEIVTMHAVNFACFVAMFASFEYLLIAVNALARSTRRSTLGGPWGLVAAYVLFGIFALTMTPMELTTPDWLASAATFLAFGALLRLNEGSARPLRDALVLGVALGLGALAKSFLVPWAVVCFVVLAIATRRRGMSITLIALGAWMVFVLPWSAVLSIAAGRPTFGDAGRLTFAWYVNEQDPPSLHGVPIDARQPRTESILRGVGVTGYAPGTDPMWFDPARWNASLAPHWNLHDQLGTLKVFELFYIQNLAPLLFLAFVLAAAPPGSRRLAWRRGWVVFVPMLAGLAAYALVIVTARYIMAFLLAGTLTMLAALPIARRIRPAWALVGMAIPLAIEAIQARTISGLGIVTSILGGTIAGVLVPPRRRWLWVLALIIAIGLTRLVLPPSNRRDLLLGAACLLAAFWFLARRAVVTGRPVRFAYRAQAALATVLAIVLLTRLGVRLNQDLDKLRTSATEEWNNVEWKVAGDLAAHGVTPGTRIALIGPHAESYWARTARVNIAADVPPPVIDEFWRLTPAVRDSLLDQFALAGATVAIATIGPENTGPDGTWTPLRYHGWMRRLTR
ncbi:MAG TPA: hypothetical protein VGQ56_06535 [Gemmatimonadaceae bacterium]|nr:hypothetical protein [Gemmatimonadaceae bacterium]